MKLPDFLENDIFKDVKHSLNISNEDMVEVKFNVSFKKLNLEFKNRRYTKDWTCVSNAYKEYIDWKCEVCGLDCSITKYYLHTHHVNNNRYNNSYNNLKALCMACLKKEE